MNHASDAAAAPRAAIFDLDGTLADTLQDIAGVVNFCLEAMGEEPRPADEYRMLIGDGLPVLCRRVLEASSGPPDADRVEELRRMVMERYDSHLIVATVLYPGVAGLLDRLRAARAPLAVLSNKPDRHTRRIVDALVPAGTFRAVFGHGPDLPRKPDPAGALHVARLLETPPERCLFVGDSGVDMRTARAAGMLPVGVLWGFRERDELERDGARRLVREPKEIAALVLGPERRSDC